MLFPASKFLPTSLFPKFNPDASVSLAPGLSNFEEKSDFSDKIPLSPLPLNADIELSLSSSLSILLVLSLTEDFPRGSIPFNASALALSGFIELIPESSIDFLSPAALAFASIEFLPFSSEEPCVSLVMPFSF